MSGQPPRSDKRLLRDPLGRVRASGLWLGKVGHPVADWLVLVTCPGCDSEQSAMPDRLEQWQEDWRIEFRRQSFDAPPEIIEHVWREPKVACVRCCVCGLTLCVQMVGTLPDPWGLGVGVIKPMPNFPAVDDDDIDLPDDPRPPGDDRSPAGSAPTPGAFSGGGSPGDRGTGGGAILHGPACSSAAGGREPAAAPPEAAGTARLRADGGSRGGK